MTSIARKAFSLLELTVAIALGAVIVSTAFSAFHVAQGFIATGNRLADENAILRAGYAFAVDELDTWSRMADPAVQSRASDRVSDAPTTAFAELGGPAGSSANETIVNLVDNRPTEDWWHWRDRHDPDPLGKWHTWRNVEPPTGAKTPRDLDGDPHDRFPFLGLSGSEAEAIYEACHGFYDLPIPGFTDAGFDPTIRRLLFRDLGWYGYLRYLPPHAMTIEVKDGKLFYPKWDGRKNDRHLYEGIPDHEFKYWSDWNNATFFYDDQYLGDDAPGGHASPMVNSLFQPMQDDANNLWTDWTLDGFRNRTLSFELLGDERPAHWPNLYISVRRDLDFGEEKAIIEVNAKSPVSGQLLGLRFRSWGTTLRGARISRGLEELPPYPIYRELAGP